MTFFFLIEEAAIARPAKKTKQKNNPKQNKNTHLSLILCRTAHQTLFLTTTLPFQSRDDALRVLRLVKLTPIYGRQWIRTRKLVIDRLECTVLTAWQEDYRRSKSRTMTTRNERY